MKIPLFEHSYNLINQHNKCVDNFLRSKNIPPRCAEFNNLALYSQVKTVLQMDIVHRTHIRQFNKFCRLWLSNSGNLKQNYLAKIQAQTQYYLNKQHNAMMRERRLANKQKKPV